MKILREISRIFTINKYIHKEVLNFYSPCHHKKDNAIKNFNINFFLFQPISSMNETKKKKNFNITDMKFNFDDLFTGIALLLCAFLCAFSLALIAIRLGPIAKWANYQTICVEQESIKSPIEWAVRKCNGRSKVYQVK